jgi:hypothetical protein
MKELVRIVICLFGLSLMGFLVADMLKEWQLIKTSLSPAWVIVPILLLFLAKELTHSPYVQDNPNLSPIAIAVVAKAIEGILIVIYILVLISVPFIWYGAIQTSIKSAG